MSLNFAEVTEDERGERAPSQVPEVLPPAGTVFSLEIIKPRFRDAEALIAEHADVSRALVVSDEESLKLAVAIVGATKKVIRSLDDQKKSLPEYKEAKGFVDKVNNFVGDLND